jgi:hypothetical protein
MVLIMQIIFALRISSNGLKNKTMKIIYTSILALTLLSCAGDAPTDSKKSSTEESVETVSVETNTTRQVNTEFNDTELTSVENENEAVQSEKITDVVMGNENESNPISTSVKSDNKPYIKPMVTVLNPSEEYVIIVESEVVQSPEEVVVTDVAAKIDHLAWDALVRKNVYSNGKVNYKGFKTSAIELNNYLAELSKEHPGSDWSKNEKLAFWINAYNAFTVKLIVDNYPLKSITDLSKPWDTKNINIAGKMYSLGGIENDILRKMNEPRIHFAINCASVSCPNLLNKAFLADKMSSQLALVTNSFFADGTKNDFSSKTIKLSKLFDWYSVDFAKGDVIKYINSNRTEQLSDKTKISYLEYDWSLNE